MAGCFARPSTRLLPADIRRTRAARMEAQPGGGSARLGGARVSPCLGAQSPRRGRLAMRSSGIGWQAREKTSRCGLLRPGAGIHDAQAIAEIGMHRHVVGVRTDRRAEARAGFRGSSPARPFAQRRRARSSAVGDDELGTGRRWPAAMVTLWRMPPGELMRIRPRETSGANAGAADERARLRNPGIGLPM